MNGYPARNLLAANPASLLEAANEFDSYPGNQTEASVKEFLEQFPLPVIFSALQSEAGLPGLENALVSCLERIFNTKYGSSFIPQYMSFVQAGLQAYTQIVRCLACKAVSSMLVNVDGDSVAAVQLVIDYDIYPLLLKCLTEGDELVAAASRDAIFNIARAPGGIELVFPANAEAVTHLNHVAAHCSSLALVRVLDLIVKLFSVSSPVASAVYNSQLLSLLESEVQNKKDVLTTLSALELFYELAESPHGTKFLLRTSLLQLLTSIIRSSSESILCSRAFLITGRLLSSDDAITMTDEFSINAILSAIDARLNLSKDLDENEYENALEALGQIGSVFQGANLLLSTPSPVGRHVAAAAFDRRGRNKQLAALHALANISGESRFGDVIILNANAEECLRNLVHAAAVNSPKQTLSGQLSSLLLQDPEIRLAAYRVMTGLVTRQWCLLAICQKQFIDIVTRSQMETAKNGMEAQFKCCKAIYMALSASQSFKDGSFAEISRKLQEAIRRGPYLPKERVEARPAIMTEERS